jgi:putative PIG3 family NAD(P)H quinone oxidoreductase
MSGMRAVVISGPGGPEVLRWVEVPEPVPGAGEALVEVVSAGVNRADLLQRAGHYDPPPGASPYPGMECAGRVVALGPEVGAGWSVGDEVCALLAGGGYAERVAVPVGQLLPVPAGVSLVDAAALPEAACTVWSNLIGAAGLRAGETLLVHGGGSGIGTFAIQFARELGVTVLTTARAAKHAALRELGAAHTIDYTSQDFAEVVGEVTGGRGVDVILDIQGAAYLSRNIRSLARGGRLVVIGLQGGVSGEVNLAVVMAKRAIITGTTLRSRSLSEKEEIVSGVREQVWPLIADGRIRPVVDRRLPLPEAAVAHEVVGRTEHLGKVLLVAP